MGMMKSFPTLPVVLYLLLPLVLAESALPLDGDLNSSEDLVRNARQGTGYEYYSTSVATPASTAATTSHTSWYDPAGSTTTYYPSWYTGTTAYPVVTTAAPSTWPAAGTETSIGTGGTGTGTATGGTGTGGTGTGGTGTGGTGTGGTGTGGAGTGSTGTGGTQPGSGNGFAQIPRIGNAGVQRTSIVIGHQQPSQRLPHRRPNRRWGQYRRRGAYRGWHPYRIRGPNCNRRPQGSGDQATGGTATGTGA